MDLEGVDPGPHGDRRPRVRPVVIHLVVLDREIARLVEVQTISLDPGDRRTEPVAVDTKPVQRHLVALHDEQADVAIVARISRFSMRT